MIQKFEYILRKTRFNLNKYQKIGCKSHIIILRLELLKYYFILYYVWKSSRLRVQSRNLKINKNFGVIASTKINEIRNTVTA